MGRSAEALLEFGVSDTRHLTATEVIDETGCPSAQKPGPLTESFRLLCWKPPEKAISTNGDGAGILCESATLGSPPTSPRLYSWAADAAVSCPDAQSQLCDLWSKARL